MCSLRKIWCFRLSKLCRWQEREGCGSPSFTTRAPRFATASLLRHILIPGRWHKLVRDDVFARRLIWSIASQIRVSGRDVAIKRRTVSATLNKVAKRQPGGLKKRSRPLPPRKDEELKTSGLTIFGLACGAPSYRPFHWPTSRSKVFRPSPYAGWLDHRATWYTFSFFVGAAKRNE